MKTVLKISLSLAFLSLVFAPKVSAQGKYGATPADSIECVKNISFLADEFKQKNYDAALPLYREIMRLCPKASQNTYLRGITLMKYLADKEQNEVQKQKYVDTVLWLYDQRFEVFGRPSKGEIAYRKAAELMDYRQNNHEEIMKLYQDAIDNGYVKADAYSQIMQQAKFMYEKKILSGEAVADKYEKLSQAIDKLPAGTEKEEAKKNVDGLFLAIPELNSCENLIAMYTPKFQENPNDLNLIKGIRYRLSNTEGCVETQLFADVVEAGYRLEPNAESAIMLAKLFFAKNDKEKGKQYLEEAIKNETDGIQKATYLMQAANLYLQDNQISQAISYSRQAISANPNLGEPYMIIGNCYGKMAHGINKSCDDFGGRSVYWLIVDQFNKAKSIDPNLAGSVNSAIATYSQLFPAYNDIFLNEFTVGQSYNVNCGGIVGTTTIRARK